jgi:hypothetical protein
MTVPRKLDDSLDTSPETLAKFDPALRVVGVFQRPQVTPERFAEELARDVAYALANGSDRSSIVRLLRAQADRTEADERAK